MYQKASKDGYFPLWKLYLFKILNENNRQWFLNLKSFSKNPSAYFHKKFYSSTERYVVRRGQET